MTLPGIARLPAMTAPLLLAVAIAGLPWWNDGGVRGAGAVVIAGAKPSVLTQSSAAVPGDPEPGNGFGTALARGDFDGDGTIDLAVGAPAEAEGTGAVTVLYGTRSQLLPGPAPTNPDFSARFGAAPAATASPPLVLGG
jgi:hypothetical protein